jgi:hypothetical protein
MSGPMRFGFAGFVLIQIFGVAWTQAGEFVRAAIW